MFYNIFYIWFNFSQQAINWDYLYRMEQCVFCCSCISSTIGKTGLGPSLQPFLLVEVTKGQVIQGQMSNLRELISCLRVPALQPHCWWRSSGDFFEVVISLISFHSHGMFSLYFNTADSQCCCRLFHWSFTLSASCFSMVLIHSTHIFQGYITGDVTISWLPQCQCRDMECGQLNHVASFRITMTSYWALWRLKSPASRLFTQPFIRAQIKENIKALRHWPLCGELTGDQWIPRTTVQ